MTDHSTKMKEEPSAEKKPKKEDVKNIKMIVTGILVSFLLAVLVFLIVFGIGLYKFNWQSEFVFKVYKVVPYPIAVVDYKLLSFSNFLKDVDTLTHFYGKQQELSNGQLVVPSQEEIKKNVLDKVIREKLVEKIAKRYNVSVNQEEIDQELDKIIDQAGSEEEVSKTLQEFYGWDEEKFKDKVLRPFLFEQKVQMAISMDEELNITAKTRAEEVLNLAKLGEKSFEELAQEYSEDTTALSGGDLGVFSRGMMVEEFEEAVFSLEPGQTSDLVKTMYGYHIIKLEDKFIDEEGVEQVRARHILIRTKDLDSYLVEVEDSSRVWRFIEIN